MSEDFELDDAFAEEEVKEAVEAPNDLKEQYEERLMRLQAEFDNYRKFMERTQETQKKRAGEDLLRDIICVMDDLERAMDNPGDVDTLLQGVQMVYVSMLDILQRRGIQVIMAENERFDPYYHEAIERLEDPEGEPGKITKVYQKGYISGDSVIRHARVAVCAHPPVPEKRPKDEAHTKDEPDVEFEVSAEEGKDDDQKEDEEVLTI